MSFFLISIEMHFLPNIVTIGFLHGFMQEFSHGPVIELVICYGAIMIHLIYNRELNSNKLLKIQSFTFVLTVTAGDTPQNPLVWFLQEDYFLH